MSLALSLCTDDDSARSRILRACVLGDVETVRTLRDDVSIRGLVDFENGRTALHYVPLASKNSAQMTEVLLEAGCPADVVDAHGITPFILAHMYNNKGVLEAYRRAGRGGLDEGPFRPYQPGWTNLMRACYSGKVAQIQHCLSNGDDLDAQYGYGLTALHVAVSRRNALAVQMLLDAGCSVDVQDSFKWTPLMLACRRGWADMAAMLLKKTANSCLLDGEGQGILQTAVLQGNRDILSCILQHEPDIFTRWTDADHPHSPLELAVLCGHENVITWLIDEGVPILRSALNAALRVAVKLGTNNLIRTLIRMGAAAEVEHLTIAVQRDDMELCQYLIACGVSFKVNSARALPLTAACRVGNVKCIRMLLEAGLRPDSEFTGFTDDEYSLNDIPLAVAIRHGWSNVVFELLRAGADPDLDHYCVTGTGVVRKRSHGATTRWAEATDDAVNLSPGLVQSVHLCLQAGANYRRLSALWLTSRGAADHMPQLSAIPSLQHLCAASVWSHVITYQDHNNSFIHVQKAVENLPVPSFFRDLLLFPYGKGSQSVLSQLWSEKGDMVSYCRRMSLHGLNAE